jgi:hypothetical protein
VRRLGGKTRKSNIIRVWLAPISEKEIVRKVTCVSSHTVYLSVGYTRLAIVRSLVKPKRLVADRFFFLLTPLNNLGFCHLNKVREVSTRSSRMKVRPLGMRKRLPMLKHFHLCLLLLQSHSQRLLWWSLLPCC